MLRTPLAKREDLAIRTPVEDQRGTVAEDSDPIFGGASSPALCCHCFSPSARAAATPHRRTFRAAPPMGHLKETPTVRRSPTNYRKGLRKPLGFSQGRKGPAELVRRGACPLYQRTYERVSSAQAVPRSA